MIPCHGCTKPIEPGHGMTVDPDRNRWHPACRAAHLAGQATSTRSTTSKRKAKA